MTPKRYLVFGSVAILIQGAVVASAPQSPLQLTSTFLDDSAAKKSHTQISLNLSQSEATKSSTTIAHNKTDSDSGQPKSKESAQVDMSSTKATTTHITQSVNTLAKASIPTQHTTTNALPTKTAPHEASPPTQQGALVHTNKSLAPDKPQAVDAMTQIATTQSENTPTPEQKRATDKQNTQTIDSKDPAMPSQTVELTQARFSSPPPQPSYPRMARKKGLEGTATIEVMFNALGEQLALTLVQSSGFGLLDNAALDAVKHWQFEAPTPTLASHYKVRVPIRFALN